MGAQPLSPGRNPPSASPIPRPTEPGHRARENQGQQHQHYKAGNPHLRHEATWRNGGVESPQSRPVHPDQLQPAVRSDKNPPVTQHQHAVGTAHPSNTPGQRPIGKEEEQTTIPLIIHSHYHIPRANRNTSRTRKQPLSIGTHVVEVLVEDLNPLHKGVYG